jgi:hypothetical protein
VNYEKSISSSPIEFSSPDPSVLNTPVKASKIQIVDGDKSEDGYNLRSKELKNKDSVAYFFLSFNIYNSKSRIYLKNQRSLIDSGAGKSYISAELARALKVTTTDGSTSYLADSTLKVATQDVIEILELRFKQNKFRMKFSVIENLSHPIILGMDWWKLTQPRIDFDNNSICLNINKKNINMKFMSREESIGKIFTTNIENVIDPLFNLIPPALHSFVHLFKKHENIPSQLPPELHYSMKIKEGQQVPKGCAIYPLDELKMSVLDKFIKDKLALGHIEPSKSPVVSPVLLVPKASGDLRVCVDYRKLNSVTEDDSYPLPLLPDIAAMVSHAKVFSKLDLLDAFNQIPVQKDQRYLTAFKCCFGVFQNNVMPFGLKNAPACFQRMIDNTLQPLLGKCCVAYIDDILIFS